jgi:hypothetical protein
MDILVIEELTTTTNQDEPKYRVQCPISHAIAQAAHTAEKALITLDMLAPCIWPRLVLAQAEIEALRSELRAARDGEERAYEALKRLRTRSRTQTRSSPRARNTMSIDDSPLMVPANQQNPPTISSLTNHNEMEPSKREVGQVPKGEMPEPSIALSFSAQGVQRDERMFSGSLSPDSIRGVLFRELQGTQDRLAAAALREEALRTELDNARRMLAGECSRLSENDTLYRRRHAECDDLRREVAKRDGFIAELLAHLQEEQSKSARHRDVAATVRLHLLSHLRFVTVHYLTLQ